MDETPCLNKQQAFQLIEEGSHEEQQRLDLEIAEVKHRLEQKGHKETIESAARETECTFVEDSDAEIKDNKAEKGFARQIGEVRGVFEARVGERLEQALLHAAREALKALRIRQARAGRLSYVPWAGRVIPRRFLV